MFINAPSRLLPYVPAAVGEPIYVIYMIRERATGRHYVGLTCRTLRKRIAAHISQARRTKPVRQNGLMEAIRRALAAGLSFAEAFEAKIAEEAHSVSEARKLEQLWIETLDAAQPIGFNIMPGGSSIGPQGNAKALAVPDSNVETSRLAGTSSSSASKIDDPSVSHLRQRFAAGVQVQPAPKVRKSPVCVPIHSWA